MEGKVEQLQTRSVTLHTHRTTAFSQWEPVPPYSSTNQKDGHKRPSGWTNHSARHILWINFPGIRCAGAVFIRYYRSKIGAGPGAGVQEKWRGKGGWRSVRTGDWTRAGCVHWRHPDTTHKSSWAGMLCTGRITIELSSYLLSKLAIYILELLQSYSQVSGDLFPESHLSPFSNCRLIRFLTIAVSYSKCPLTYLDLVDDSIRYRPRNPLIDYLRLSHCQLIRFLTYLVLVVESIRPRPRNPLIDYLRHYRLSS